MRGRVIAIALGGTPIGSPIVGWVADHFGPRWALGVGAASGLTAALVGLAYLFKYRNVRLSFSRPYISLDTCEDSPPQSFGRLQREIG